MIKYIQSEVLNKKVKLDTEAGTVTVDESKLFGKGRISYSSEECQIIKETIGEIDIQIHRVKSIFDGVVVREKLKPDFKDKYKDIPIY